MKRYVPFIIIAVVLIGGIATFFVLFRKGGNSNANTTFTEPGQQAANPASSAQPPADTAGMTRPNVKVSSPVILEEYGDYQCPPCGALHPVLKSLESEYGNQVRVVFRHFPLPQIHKHAIVAASAAEAARLQGKFVEMHDRLYRNQNAWKDLDDPRPVFTGYARDLGLNIDRFGSDMESSRVAQAIATDLKHGQSIGVTGTPTVFIEGHMLPYEATTPEGLRRGINVMLQRKAVS